MLQPRSKLSRTNAEEYSQEAIGTDERERQTRPKLTVMALNSLPDTPSIRLAHPDFGPRWQRVTLGHLANRLEGDSLNFLI